MPVAGAGIGFWIAGLPVEPVGDPAWWAASPAQRRRFWRFVADRAEQIYAAERERGIDRHGKRLAALAPYTIEHRHSAMGPADPDAPPLIPAHALSRTVSLLVSQATPNGAWFRWRRWHRQSWGQILTWHAQGLVRRAPARDVMGISPQGMSRLASEANAWWQARRPASPPLKVTIPPPVPPTRPIVPKPATPLPPGWHTTQATTRFGGHLDFFSRPAAWLRSHLTPWRQYRPPAPRKDS